MICRTCGDEFDPSVKKKMRGGFIDECPVCAYEDRQRMYLGRPGATHKGSNIEIFRTDLEFARSVIRREQVIGFNANLGVNHPVALQKQAGLREERNR